MTRTTTLHPATLLLLGLLGCEPSTTTPSATIYFFPDESLGMIPYRSGGQFVAGVHAEIGQLVGNTHAFILLDSSTGPGGSNGAQPVTLQPGDAGLGGTVVLTWPQGGNVPVHAAVAGVTIATTIAPLVKPALGFHSLGSTDNGTQWVYSYCLESSMDDGMVALHLDQATFASGTASGTADTTLTLVAGPCEGVPPKLSPLRSHAAYTVAASGSSFHATASYAPAPLVVPEDDVPVPPHVPPTIQIGSPNPVFTSLSIVEIDIHVDVAGSPAAGMSVVLQSIPPLPAGTLLPATLVTDKAGNATARFQMPQSGPIEIDASIGPTRQVRVFSP